MTNENHADWYTTTFKSWAPKAKLVGPKPTAEQLATVHRLGARPGKQAMAIAMGLRDCGVTGSQIVMVCGAPQLNKMRGFVDDRLLKKLPVPHDANGHVVYKLELTPKGQQRIDSALKREAAQLAAEQAEPAEKPVKAKATKKATKAPAKAKGASKRKAKGDQPASTEALSEPASATVTVPEGAPFEGVDHVPVETPVGDAAPSITGDNNPL
jgi:hypothetical protein